MFRALQHDGKPGEQCHTRGAALTGARDPLQAPGWSRLPRRVIRSVTLGLLAAAPQRARPCRAPLLRWRALGEGVVRAREGMRPVYLSDDLLVKFSIQRQWRERVVAGSATCWVQARL